MQDFNIARYISCKYSPIGKKNDTESPCEGLYFVLAKVFKTQFLRLLYNKCWQKKEEKEKEKSRTYGT